MVIVLQLIIRLYQKTLSPDHGWLRGRHPYGFCRFYPSCSQYAYDFLGRYGFLKGTYLAIKRILHCNPWAQPAVDSISQH